MRVRERRVDTGRMERQIRVIVELWSNIPRMKHRVCRVFPQFSRFSWLQKVRAPEGLARIKSGDLFNCCHRFGLLT